MRVEAKCPPQGHIHRSTCAAVVRTSGHQHKGEKLQLENVRGSLSQSQQNRCTTLELRRCQEKEGTAYPDFLGDL